MLWPLKSKLCGVYALLVGFQSINLTSKLFYHVTNSARSPMAERKLCFSSDVLALMSICSLYLKCIWTCSEMSKMQHKFVRTSCTQSRFAQNRFLCDQCKNDKIQCWIKAFQETFSLSFLPSEQRISILDFSWNLTCVHSLKICMYFSLYISSKESMCTQQPKWISACLRLEQQIVVLFSHILCGRVVWPTRRPNYIAPRRAFCSKRVEPVHWKIVYRNCTRISMILQLQRVKRSIEN
jgi:hypothetical protein